MNLNVFLRDLIRSFNFGIFDFIVRFSAFLKKFM